MKKFLAGFLVVCVLAAAFVAGHVVYRGSSGVAGVAADAGTKKDDRVVVMDGKTGEVSVVKDQKMYDLMKSMDRKAEEARRNAPSPEESRKKFRSVWEEIKSHMVDPEPGTYPVRFYGPVEEDGVHLMSGFGETKAFWVDDRHVAYWGGVLKDPLPKMGWYDHHELVVLDVDAGKIVKEFARAEGLFHGGICFDSRNKRFFYWVPDKGFTPHDDYKNKLRTDHIGYLDANMDFRIGEGVEKPRCLHLGTSPEDGKIKEKEGAKPKFTSGECTAFLPDGSQKDISLGMRGSCTMPSYDAIRDQYYISLHYSEEDQRSKVFYFDRSFDLVEEFTLPRVLLQGGYPGSFFGGGSSKPAKDGFVIGCGRRGDNEAKIDFDGEPVRNYLCHVRRDQKIVRALAGSVNGLAVSPNGCRVFGFWKERSNTNKLYGKNFMVDLCATGNKNIKGE